MASNNNTLVALALPVILTISGCNSVMTKNAPEAAVEPPARETTTDRAKETITPPLKKPSSGTQLSLKPRLSIEDTSNTSLPEEPAKAHENLWQRIQDKFALDIPENDRVEREIERFVRYDKHLQQVQERAVPYLFFIAEEIEKRNLPGELALLPVIESAYRPFAFSAGRAAGLWQFIPSTGKLYGLEQNWWYDGRRDVVAATHAALDHLKELSEQFDGDWELALAAYNAGPGGVSRAIRSNSDKGEPTDFWSLDLPKETKHYVPRLLALAKMFSDPEKYSLTLSAIPNRPYFESIDTQSQLDLALAADMAGISIDDLYRLNPGFNRWATAPDGPHRLNIPVNNSGTFKQKLAQLSQNDRLKWTRYQIGQGDNLGSIANKFGTTVTLLKQVNKLRDNRIRAGKHLLIPVPSQNPEQYASLAESSPTPKDRTIHYTVRAGDSFWGIGRKYNISPKVLAGWNNLALNSTLRPGQKLIIKVQTASNRAISLPTRAQSKVSSRSSVRYRVRKGDSLFSIAERFQVSVADLRKWNSLPSKYLQPGQKINLYVDQTAQTL